MKCRNCTREAEGGFRKCLICRQNSVQFYRRRVARGWCRWCENPKLIGYNFCHSCEIKSILQKRKIRNIVVRGDLYVLQTPRGLKVGRSIRLARRIKQVSREYFGGARLQLDRKSTRLNSSH